MPASFLLVLLAVAAGIAVALQGQFMGAMNRASGTVNGIFFTYGVGALLATTVWLFRRDRLEGVHAIPGYAWTAGALGLAIVGGIGFAAPRLGLARTLVITVAAQLLAAAIMEHFGLFSTPQRSFDLPRAAGFALTVAGVWLVVKG